jgi:hypothetical protein
LQSVLKAAILLPQNAQVKIAKKYILAANAFISSFLHRNNAYKVILCTTALPKRLHNTDPQVLRDYHFDDDEKSAKKESGRPVFRQNAAAEKKLSVLDSALKDNPNSVLLLTKRLKILADVSDPAAVDHGWKELLERFPSDVVVWKSYTRFLSTRFSSFRCR